MFRISNLYVYTYNPEDVKIKFQSNFYFKSLDRCNIQTKAKPEENGA